MSSSGSSAADPPAVPNLIDAAAVTGTFTDLFAVFDQNPFLVTPEIQRGMRRIGHHYQQMLLYLLHINSELAKQVNNDRVRGLRQELDASVVRLQAQMHAFREERDATVADLEAEIRTLQQERDAMVDHFAAEIRTFQQAKQAAEERNWMLEQENANLTQVKEERVKQTRTEATTRRFPPGIWLPPGFDARRNEAQSPGGVQRPESADVAMCSSGEVCGQLMSA